MARRGEFTSTSVIVLLGSGVALALGWFSLSAPASHLDLRGSIALLVAATWGFSSGIGVLFRQRWARISILVFSGFIVFFALLTAPLVPVVGWMIPDLPQEAVRGVKIALPITDAILFALGLWWIYLFNTAASREAFGLPAAGETTKPVSILCPAWYLIAFGALGIASAARESPFIFLIFVLTDRNAALAWFINSVLEIGAGFRLLTGASGFQGRKLAMGLFGFDVVDAAVFFLLPGSSVRIKKYYTALVAYYRGRAPERPPWDAASASAVLRLAWLEWSILAIVGIILLMASRKSPSRQPIGPEPDAS